MTSLIDALELVSARLISLVGAGGKTNLMFGLAREFAAAGERVLVTTTTKIGENCTRVQLTNLTKNKSQP